MAEGTRKCGSPYQALLLVATSSGMRCKAVEADITQTEHALAASVSVTPDLRALVGVGDYEAPRDEDDVRAGAWSSEQSSKFRFRD
jgi:hypothetical protein